jgi:hypothetical protein
MQVSHGGAPKPKPWSRWSPTELKTLGELTAAGIKATVIAETLGRSPKSTESMRRIHFPRARPTHCKTCQQALPELQAQRGRPREYCNSTCQMQHRQARHHTDPPRTCTCMQCGQSFLAPRPTRYCSRACSHRAWYERARVDPVWRAKTQLRHEQRKKAAAPRSAASRPAQPHR